MIHKPISEQSRRRIVMFDEFIGNTAFVASQFDEKHFEPTILPIVRQLEHIAENAFLANVTDDGLVTFPESARMGEGFGVVPLLNQNEVLHAKSSLGMPTPKRIADAALAHNVSPSRLFDVARQDVSDKKDAPPFDTISLETISGACLGNYDGYEEVDGVPVYLVSRPYVVVGPLMLRQGPISQGVAGVHEFVHGVDKQNRPAPEVVNAGPLSYANQVEELARLELRAYHVGHGALMSVDLDYADKIMTADHEQITGMRGVTSKVERIRKQHATSKNSFNTSEEVINILKSKLGVLAGENLPK